MGEAEVKTEKTIEEETEAKIEEETALQVRVDGAAIKTRMKAQENIKLMEKGMLNPKCSVIIARNMCTMKMNVGKRKMT